MKNYIAVVGACCMGIFYAGVSFAAFTLPTLDSAGLEDAGTAVAALIAIAVVIGVVFRLLKKA